MPIPITQRKSTLQLNLCPRLLFLESYAEAFQRDFIRAISIQDRAIAQRDALHLARVICNVVLPFAQDAKAPEYCERLEKLSRSLQVLSSRRQPGEPVPCAADFEFPPDGGRQLLQDKLEDIAADIRGIRRLIDMRSGKGAA